MKLFTLTRTCPYEAEHTILGIFNDLEGVVERIRMFKEITDAGEQYKIECFILTSLEEQKTTTQKYIDCSAKLDAELATNKEEDAYYESSN
jgi:hypothetical protein